MHVQYRYCAELDYQLDHALMEMKLLRDVLADALPKRAVMVKAVRKRAAPDGETSVTAGPNKAMRH